MQIALALFCVGVVWFYGQFLYALLRERPRRHVIPTRLRKDMPLTFAAKKTKSSLGRVA